MRGYQTKLLQAALGLFVCASCCATSHADVFTSSDPQFTLVEPDGYVQVPVSGDMVYSCATSDPNFSMPDAIIEVMRLPSTTGAGPADLDDPTLKTYVPDASATTEKWKTFTINGLYGHTRAGQYLYSIRAAVIPLQGNAIFVGVLTPVAKESTAEPILQNLIAGIDGPSSWSSFVGFGPGKGFGQLSIFFIMLGGAIGLVLKHIRDGKKAGENSILDKP